MKHASDLRIGNEGAKRRAGVARVTGRAMEAVTPGASVAGATGTDSAVEVEAPEPVHRLQVWGRRPAPVVRSRRAPCSFFTGGGSWLWCFGCRGNGVTAAVGAGVAGGFDGGWRRNERAGPPRKMFPREKSAGASRNHHEDQRGNQADFERGTLFGFVRQSGRDRGHLRAPGCESALPHLRAGLAGRQERRNHGNARGQPRGQACPRGGARAARRTIYPSAEFDKLTHRTGWLTGCTGSVRASLRGSPGDDANRRRRSLQRRREPTGNDRKCGRAAGPASAAFRGTGSTGGGTTVKRSRRRR